MTTKANNSTTTTNNDMRLDDPTWTKGFTAAREEIVDDCCSPEAAQAYLDLVGTPIDTFDAGHQYAFRMLIASVA